MTPVVSVIIPAYNTEAYIAQAIASALNQTLQEIEVIVVDDASSDRTVEIVQSIQDRRLRLLTNDQNLGAAEARNRALQEAKGDWIAVLDSDDWYAPNRLEQLLQVAQAQQADLVADDLYLIHDQAAVPHSTLIQSSGQAIAALRQVDPIFFVETDVYGRRGLHLGFSKPLIRRAFLSQHQLRYDPKLRLGQDFWLYLNCLARGARFFLLPTPYYYYRSRPGSLVKQGKVVRLEYACHASEAFLQSAIAHQTPGLAIAVERNLRVFRQNLAYYRVVEPLKQGKGRQAIAQLVRHPYCLVHFVRQLPGILERRWQAYRPHRAGIESAACPRAASKLSLTQQVMRRFKRAG